MNLSIRNIVKFFATTRERFAIWRSLINFKTYEFDMHVDEQDLAMKTYDVIITNRALHVD